MGYRCPVCGDPQADGIHLANHLAFTALVRGGDHEAWLDEHVPDWERRDEEALAGEVTGLAESAEYPQVFEDTTGQSDHDHQHDHSPRGAENIPVDIGTVERQDPEAAEEIMAEAREMTRQRRREVDQEGPGDGEEPGDEGSEDGSTRDTGDETTHEPGDGGDGPTE